MKRNLLYQVCPFKHNSQWRTNIDFLKPYLHIFNHKLLVTIKTGDHMAPFDEVVSYFGNDHPITFIPIENNSSLAESQGFFYLLKEICSLDSEEISFYGHTKGISPKFLPEDYPLLNKWVYAMYHYNLSNPIEIDSILSVFSCSGCFKRYLPKRDFFTPWHYSGSFYWFKHSDVFSTPNWETYDIGYYTSECFLPHLIPSKKAYCSLADYSLNLYAYSEKDWDKVFNRDFLFKIYCIFHTFKNYL